MKIRQLRSFDRDFRVCFRSKQTWSSPDAAVRWARAVADATAELGATHPGFENAYPLSRESGTISGGPYRDKLFGPGKKPTYRLVFRVAPDAIELVAVRHLSQADLTDLDL